MRGGEEAAVVAQGILGWLWYYPMGSTGGGGLGGKEQEQDQEHLNLETGKSLPLHGDQGVLSSCFSIQKSDLKI